MTDPHEDLVEAVAQEFRDHLWWPNDGSIDDARHLARSAISLIAERTKEATPEMIAAVRPGRSENAARTVYAKMQRASALWPKEKS